MLESILFKPKYLNTIFLYSLVLMFCYCSNPKTIIHEDDILTIDPRTFKESNLMLSEIADDVDYILLDNVIPFGREGTSFKILNNSIYVCIDLIHLVKFDINGKNPQPIGEFGRGPGEYLFCDYYTVDSKTGKIYIRGKRDAILIYSQSGEFINELIPHCDKGLMFHEMEFLNDYLFIAQFIHMGKAQYNWIITDTLGNIISQKLNYLLPFESRTGQSHGIYKFKDKISYWNMYNDTVFTISPDFSYKATIYFPPGNYRRRIEDIVWTTPQQLIEEVKKICRTIDLFETNNFWVYKYMYNMTGVAFINKKSKKTLFSFRENKSWGIENDLDGGPVFQPQVYYTESGNEYLAGMVDSFQLIEYTSSDGFKNSNPIYSIKKEELKQLASRLDINDNPVIIRVKLKK
jgi:hypothetical protein